MTRKDYDLIAACIGAALRANVGKANQDRENGVWDVKRRLVNELELENRRFDTDKFNARVQYWFDQHSGL